MTKIAAEPAPGSARVGRVAEDPLRAQLTDLDHRLLETVSWLRVVTQPQLERLHADVPDRTLRYRTRRLHRLGLLGRTRPYRDRGSEPHHLWPTSRADALVHGRPRPRRGERRPPNPLFLAHSAAISELYVVVNTRAVAAGATLTEFSREGEARERFTDPDGRERAIAPDVRIGLRFDAESLVGNVELDLGTMSHARLRTKLDGYRCHARREVAGATPSPPILLFVTTSSRRAETFMRAARRVLADADGSGPGGDLRIAVCGLARRLDDLLVDRCWHEATSAEPLTLRDLAGARER